MFDVNDEIIGRVEFDRFRWESNRHIPYDWADLSRNEKEKWIEKARARQREEGT